MTYGLREGTPSETMIRCVPNIPDLLHRRRQNSDTEGEQDLHAETCQYYGDLKLIMSEYQVTSEDFRSDRFANGVNGLAEISHSPTIQRMYSMCLFFAVTLNLILRSFKIQEEDTFVEGEHFAEEIITIAKASLSYRPFGSSHMILCLMAAHATTRDQNKQNLIVHAHKIYAKDFPWAINHSKKSGMHSLSDGLQLPGLSIH